MKTIGEGEALTHVFILRPFPTRITDVRVMDAEGNRHKGLSRRKMAAFGKRYAEDIAYVRKCATGNGQL